MARAPDLRALTSLRFFAALGVVLVHYGDALIPLLPTFLANVVRHGKNGVAFFFILSGFILAYTYGEVAAAGTLDVRAFWRSRFARVYPVYALALLVGIPAAIHYSRTVGLVVSPGYLAAFVATKIALLSAWNPAFTFDPPWAVPGWTLAVEAFFYALFPFLVPRIARLGDRALLGITVAFLLFTWAPRAILVSALSAGATPTHGALSFAQVFPPMRLAEFCLGIALATIYRRGLFTHRANVIAAFGLLLAVGGIGATDGLDIEPIGLVFTAGFALMILGFATATGVIARALAWRPLVLMGEASYSLYLLHDPVGQAMTAATKRLFGVTIRESPVALGAFLIVAILISIACYRWFEEPLRHRLRGSKPAST